MKAVGYHHSLTIDADDALLDVTLPIPEPGPNDLRVRVEAVSVNPVDTKIRVRVQPAEGQTQVLGWDAAGVVDAVGSAVEGFAVGDRVWYAGDVSRPGSNSELQLVDARIAAHRPSSLTPSAAAALPLTGLTAYEMLFDRLGLCTDTDHSGDSLLVIGAAGGVGSILVQLARQLTNIRIIATASRPDSQKWVSELGAHHVVDHRGDLVQQINELDCPPVKYVASLNQTDSHLAAIAEVIAPQGKLCLIDDPASFDIMPFKRKSVSIHWEFMFTRALFQTKDIQRQQTILTHIAALVDKGRISTTVAEHFGTINAANLKRAHALLESQQSRGKIVLEGF
ncbi:zinc-binding alcohol dehydrogenase family protein [Ferrimonas balearica]|uniref:zinc-binding alcohol dehydrogenase family protein n=1 Tax=Ferrimonas balearica TaxID=44012 RepID=UPI001C9A0DBB|nr:zinc-binding alcohol dehydrogenase family protein [Ferrimonas balearica]MBY5920235.1 zinc-binding alcohol dehydrogenase family protein [Ferrimonas balearica]MBY5997080.1 zinc-binding alcohol dehydrogenase family protein [Ferrimonas balearica]